MKIALNALLVLMFAGCLTTAANADEILLEYENVKITEQEFRDFIAVIVPEKDRKPFLADEKRVLSMLQNMFITRTLAQKAVTTGLSKGKLLQLKIKSQQERILMQAMLAKMVKDKSKPAPDFSALALEYFVANPDQFETPEQVHASHILISSKGDRSKKDGLKLANEIKNKAMVANADFAALAKELSDDPSAATNGGDLGFFAAKNMVKPFAVAAFAMTKIGAISEPIETNFGFHIIKYHARKAPGTLEFKAVKEKLIAEREKKFLAQIRSTILTDIRSVVGVAVNSDAIHNLITSE